MKKIVFFFFAMLYCSTHIFSQKWEIYSPANTGLPSDNVWSIATDSLGNKWFGTNGGLVKFDGKIWTTYNKLNSGLPSDRIYTIAIDQSGTKWLGTTEGVVKFNDSTCTVYNKLNSGLPGDTISVIAIDRSGNKWVGIAAEYGGWRDGYKYGGLARFNDTTWTVYTNSNSSLPRSYITSIAIDDSDTKWIGTFSGIVKLNGSEWTIINKNNSIIPSDSISINNYRQKWK